MKNWHNDLKNRGFAVLPPVLATSDCENLINNLGQIPVGRGGQRNLLEIPVARELARSKAIRQFVEPVLGPGCFAVRGILFDKTPDANWKVVWHQDLSLAVRTRREIAGFGPWSVKDGVPHVQPPVEILEKMLTVRLHLDNCNSQNGPLRVLPETHTLGRLEAARILVEREKREEIVCEVAQGGVLLMRPLLLHASSPATMPLHRRVIHLEFAAENLPDGLEWHERIA